MSTRGGTLRRSVRVVWSRLDSGTVAVGTRGTLASLGSIATLAECVTMAVCALFEGARDLGLGMFCKRHRCFGKMSVLSFGEAGEWMFRDFKNLLYGSFEASFLIVQAYLMCAMITPDFVALATDVLSLLPSQWSSAHWCWYSWYWMWCKHHLFFGEMVNPSLAMWACACHASSMIRFTVHSCCFPLIGCLVCGERLPCLIF